MIERFFERILFGSRWLLAPFYFGLIIGLVLLLIKFAQELWHSVVVAFSSGETDVILAVLSLIDLSLAGSLIIMVMFSGYENFVSKLEVDDHRDRPEWMGQIDFSALKLKLLASIIAISAIQLLKAFMNVNKMTDRDLMWLAGIHVVFVVSGVFMALTDRLAGDHHVPKEVPARPGDGSHGH